MQVVVRKRKYDGRVKSEWEGELLVSAEPDWLIVCHHPERHRKQRNGEALQADRLFIHCFHTVEPLAVLLQYDAQGQFEEAKCDAALPSTLDGQVVQFLDLDLDLVVSAELKIQLKDEDIFALHAKQMAYPGDVIEQAWRGIELAQSLVEARSFPFDSRFAPQLTYPANDSKNAK